MGIACPATIQRQGGNDLVSSKEKRPGPSLQSLRLVDSKAQHCQKCYQITLHDVVDPIDISWLQCPTASSSGMPADPESSDDWYPEAFSERRHSVKAQVIPL